MHSMGVSPKKKNLSPPDQFNSYFISFLFLFAFAKNNTMVSNPESSGDMRMNLAINTSARFLPSIQSHSVNFLNYIHQIFQSGVIFYRDHSLFPLLVTVAIRSVFVFPFRFVIAHIRSFTFSSGKTQTTTQYYAINNSNIAQSCYEVKAHHVKTPHVQHVSE